VTESVYCEVRDERLNYLFIFFCLGSNTFVVCCYLQETVSSQVGTLIPS
jgi:hypothetical protein